MSLSFDISVMAMIQGNEENLAKTRRSVLTPSTTIDSGMTG